MARVSVSRVRHWIKTGRLESIRRRKTLVRRAEFERFRDQQREHKVVAVTLFPPLHVCVTATLRHSMFGPHYVL